MDSALWFYLHGSPADKRTKDHYEIGKAKHFPADVAKRAARKLEYVDLAAKLEDLRTPPGN
jgi:proteic killer suppression protein